MSTKAFVIGNGKSRLGLDLETLRPHGKIFGCNALYRDFTPDVLVATDPGISTEIEKSGYPDNHVFYTRRPLNKNSLKIIENYGYSSGPVAVTLAALEEINEIYLIGFDLTGINGKHNNVYSGTPFYLNTTHDATYHGNWVNQIYNISKQFDMLTYYRVASADAFLPSEWKRKSNIVSITIDDFCKSINTLSWQRQKE